jgi:hypothetical protein
MPTQLIKKYIEEFAQWLRNQQDYDDFEYGTEVIPGDRTWVKKDKSGSCKIEDNK